MPVQISREQLLSCLEIPRWADAVAGTYDTVEDLVAAGNSAATPLTEADIDQALSGHPRIGERAQGQDASARFARDEQSASQSDDANLALALERGNAAYEAQFGRVFLIRAAGRSREEIVEQIDARMANTDAEELEVVAQQLREITELRLRALFDNSTTINAGENS